MMCAVRRHLLPLVGLGGLAALAASVPVAAPAGAAPAGAPAVATVVGRGVLDGPGGIALDSAGDLFVADTGHCRVAVVPAHGGTAYGLRLHAGRVTTLVGGSCTGPGSIGHPSGVAVDAQGDVYVAEATAQRVQVVRAGGTHQAVTVAGTGRAGFNGDGLVGTATELDEPTAVAVDGAGDLLIADTANCRVRVLATRATTVLGRPVAAGRVSTVLGTGTCGTTGQGGPAASAELWDPVAVAVDGTGDVLVADSGDQSVLLATTESRTAYGTPVAAGDIAVIVGGTGSYGPYLADGLSATGPTAELNDPRGLAVGVANALFVSDGDMHVIRVVPASTGPLLGRTMTGGDLYTAAGALPVSSPAGLGDGTRWVLTQMATPTGIAVSPSGAVYYADGALDTVRVIEPGTGTS